MPFLACNINRRNIRAFCFHLATALGGCYIGLMTDQEMIRQIEALSQRCEVSRADLMTMLGINRVTFWRISTGKTTASRPVFTRMEAVKQDLIRRLGEGKAA